MQNYPRYAWAGKIVGTRYRVEAGIYLDIVFEVDDVQVRAYRPNTLCEAKLFPSVVIPDSLNTPLLAAKSALKRLEEQERLEEDLRQETLRQEAQTVLVVRDIPMDEGMQRVIDQFLLLMEERLQSERCTTEAGVRDVVSDALIASQVQPSDIRHEEPHRHLGSLQGQIDMLVLASTALGQSAIEFKYDRAIPSGHNQPRSQKAGALFADFSRLLQWPRPDRRYFIYLTDGEMYRYLKGGRDVFGRVFQGSRGYHVELDSVSFEDISDTFRGRMGACPYKATLRNLAFKRFADISPVHYLWIFQITVTE